MARAKVRKQFALSSAKKDGKYVTRDGRKVIAWRLIRDPRSSLWPVEVTVETRRTKARVTYIVNQNGRRYANVRSEDDIFELGRKRLDPWPYDCMPNPIEAIGYIRAHKYYAVRQANKLSAEDRYNMSPKVVTNIEIGTL